MWDSNRYWTATPGRERRQDAASRRYGRGYDSSRGTSRFGESDRTGQANPSDESRRTGRPLVVPEEATESDVIVELRDEPEHVEITAEFADVSPEQVGVSLIGTEIRMRARLEPEAGCEDQQDGFERRVALTRSVDAEQADVSRSDSTLSVTLPKRDSA